MADRVIRFRGEFDVSNILASFKQIRQQAAAAGADSSLFKNIDKDIEKAEKLITQMTAQIQRGFNPDTKDLQKFASQMSNLEEIFSTLNVSLGEVGIAENFIKANKEIQQIQQKIQTLTVNQEQLNKKSSEALAIEGKKSKLTNNEISQLQEQNNNATELENTYKRIVAERAKAARQKIGSMAIASEEGQAIAASASIDVSNYDLKATTKSRDASKADLRVGSGKVETRTVDIDRAQIAINTEYTKILKEIMEGSNDAAEGVEKLQQAIRGYGITIDNTDDLQAQFQADMQRITSVTDNFTGTAKGQVTKARRSVTNLGGDVDTGEVTDTSTMNTIIYNADTSAAINGIQQIEAENQRLDQTVDAVTQEAINAQNTIQAELQQTSTSQEQIVERLYQNIEATREQAESQQNLNSAFDNLKNIAKQVLSVTSAWRALKNVISETFRDVQTLDKSFAQIAMVTDYSVEDMWQTYGDYAEMANKLGQTTNSVIQASGLFYQQGLDTAESLELTESTMKLATLAGLDFSQATSQMTAALRGFHMEMDQGEHITDVYSELAAKAAADVNGIAYAMSKTASIANSAGMSFENTAAFLTQMIETTQEAPRNYKACFSLQMFHRFSQRAS